MPVELDATRRAEAIAAGWEAYRERCADMQAAYLKACEAWQVVAVCSGSEVIGALYVKDGVIHLGIRPEWRGRWASRRVIREMLAYGTRTQLRPDEAEQAEFIGRIGFVKAGKEYVFHR